MVTKPKCLTKCQAIAFSLMLPLLSSSNLQAATIDFIASGTLRHLGRVSANHLVVDEEFAFAVHRFGSNWLINIFYTSNTTQYVSWNGTNIYCVLYGPTIEEKSKRVLNMSGSGLIGPTDEAFPSDAPAAARVIWLAMLSDAFFDNVPTNTMLAPWAENSDEAGHAFTFAVEKFEESPQLPRLVTFTLFESQVKPTTAKGREHKNFSERFVAGEYSVAAFTNWESSVVPMKFRLVRNSSIDLSQKASDSFAMEEYHGNVQKLNSLEQPPGLPPIKMQIHVFDRRFTDVQSAVGGGLYYLLTNSHWLSENDPSLVELFSKEKIKPAIRRSTATQQDGISERSSNFRRMVVCSIILVVTVFPFAFAYITRRGNRCRNAKTNN